eukprot:gb/GECG01014030.1/.p1 GENE.gb/GECG01014030.1/~~gb/GECG01014030.1/.p1  ORF type:complete len:427 (+),score=33.48 gb/GECG01014030.1/:1-1281(+)
MKENQMSGTMRPTPGSEQTNTESRDHCEEGLSSSEASREQDCHGYTDQTGNTHGRLEPKEKSRETVVNFDSVHSILAAARESLECPLCLRIFLNPRTLPCGHSFCHHCLIKSFDHKMCCPLCRHECFTSVASLPLSYSLDHTVRKLFPKEVTNRKQEIERDNTHGESHRIPLFFISGDLFVPGQSIRLRVFEPRYLLMVERIMQTDKLFGLQESAEVSLGALVQLQDVSRRPGGDMIVLCTVKSRYYLDTTSVRVEADTYSLHTGNATVFDDVPLESPSNTDRGEGFGEQLFDILHRKFKDSIDKMDMRRSISFFHVNGHLPSSPEQFSFFAVGALNFPVHLKYRCAELVDPVERLRIVYAFVYTLCKMTKQLFNESGSPSIEDTSVLVEAANTAQNLSASEILNEAAHVRPESLYPLDEVTLPLV